MATLSTFEAINDALRDTIVENWQAKIDALNPNRTVEIRSTKTENYTVPTAGTIDIEVDGTTTTVTPTEGGVTAATLVTDFDAAIAALGCVDSSGRFILRHGTAASTADKKLKVVSDTNGLAAALGLNPGDISHRAPLRALPRDHYYDYMPNVYNKAPYLILEEMGVEGEENLKSRALYWAPVKLTFGDRYQGGSYQPAMDLMRGYARALREIITENRTLGGVVVTAKMSEMQLVPRLVQFDEKGPMLAEMGIDLLIRVWNT